MGDEALGLKATIIDMSRKADAMRVDEVMKILAQQMDRLTAVTTEDFEQLRTSVQRFLELSPDLRKAALSNGLHPREECMACSMLNKTPRTGRKMIQGSDSTQTIQGTNNVLYRLSPTAGKNYEQQADKIIHEKLKFPTRLKQSVNMARDQNMDTPLRQLMNKGAAWISGAEQSQAPSGHRGSAARVSVGGSSQGGGGDDGANRFSVRAFFPSAGGAPTQQHNQSVSEASTVSKGSIDPGMDRAATASPALPPPSPMPPPSEDEAESPVSPPTGKFTLDMPTASSPQPPGDDGEDEDAGEPADADEEDPDSPQVGNTDGYAGMQDYEEGSFMSSNEGDFDD